MTSRRAELIALGLLLALTFAMFGDVLFNGGTRVIGFQTCDLYLQFLPWRDFGFRELAKGNLALWNPYIFGGAPYFGSLQAALLYPPNWFFLILPLAPAVNWSVALHVFAVGVFAFCWMRVRGLHVSASFLGGVLIMFGGAHFLHIFAGHLPHLLTMTWAPLIFCAIDGLFKHRTFGWSLVGIFAVAMQVLAGFPQHVFYTALAAGLYSALRLTQSWSWQLAAGLLAIYLGGAAISAVQLLPAGETMRETIRGVPLPFEFASRLAFPPENFITLLAPSFFGETALYWGRGLPWETCLFVGVAGVLLALYAVVCSEWKTKSIPIVVLIFAVVLALGVHTPLYRVLYEWLPDFNKFRSVSKFIFTASLFLVLLAGTGFDRLLKRKRAEVGFITGAFVLAALLGCGAYSTLATDQWRPFMDKIHYAEESSFSSQLYTSAELGAHWQRHAAVSLIIAATTCALFAGLLALSKWNARALYGVVALAILEMFWFVHAARPTFDSKSVISGDEKIFLDQHPGDYRIMNRFNPNSAMSIRVPEFWGYDASVVRRYAEFVAWSQGADPDKATQDVNFKWADPLFAMLRLAYILLPEPGNFRALEVETPPLPHVLLVSNYRVLNQRDAIFAALGSPVFDPRAEVILETEPDPKPLPLGIPGNAQIIGSGTDTLTIEADTRAPAILLITDVFTPSWRAVSLPGSSQSTYHLQPANYVLRAVPLSAGHHRLRVEYFSRAFEIGKWISLVSIVLFLGVIYRFRRTEL